MCVGKGKWNRNIRTGDHLPIKGGLIQSYNEILRDYDKT